MESRIRVLVKMQKEVMGWRQIEAIRKHKPWWKEKTPEDTVQHACTPSRDRGQQDSLHKVGSVPLGAGSTRIRPLTTICQKVVAKIYLPIMM